jgi:hypothetical protein
VKGTSFRVRAYNSPAMNLPTKAMMFLLAGALGGCIEGVDPNACLRDADCADGTVCGAAKRCLASTELHDVTVSWTIDGVVPSTAMPGRCGEAAWFGVGFANGLGSFFTTDTHCTDGTALVVHVPRDYATVMITAYQVGNVLLDEVTAAVPDVQEASVGLLLTFP